MEGIVQRDHDHHNVMVVVKESLKTEHIVTLQDSEGEFLRCDPAYHDWLRIRSSLEVFVSSWKRLSRWLHQPSQTISDLASRDEKLTINHQATARDGGGKGKEELAENRTPLSLPTRRS